MPTVDVGGGVEPYHEDSREPMKIAHPQVALAWPLHVLRTPMQDLPNASHRSYLPQIRQRAPVLHGRNDRKHPFERSQYLSQGPAGRAPGHLRRQHALPLL